MRARNLHPLRWMPPSIELEVHLNRSERLLHLSFICNPAETVYCGRPTGGLVQTGRALVWAQGCTNVIGDISR